MKVDIFPALNLPVIYVCQPYGGMDPAQMEGLLTNYYEYHFLYISGIHHVESAERPGHGPDEAVLPSRHRHGPGDGRDDRLRQPLAGLHAAGHRLAVRHALRHRQRAGRLPRPLQRDEERSARSRTWPCSRSGRCSPACPGVSAPPPFGGSQRTVVVRVDPDRLRSYGMSPDEVIAALTAGNTISPSGNVRIGDQMPIVPVNAHGRRTRRSWATIPIRPGEPRVYLRDVGTVEDATDIPTGYALVNGRRAVYILVTKRADASTLDGRQRRQGEPARRCRRCCPTTSRSASSSTSRRTSRARCGAWRPRGPLGAGLTGLMVLLFLRDWRSVIVVVLNIPLALLGAAGRPCG